MRPYSAFGIALIVLGVLMLSIRSFTYFTTDQVVGPLGYFAWDVNQPHTLFINPLAGIVAVAAGLALVFLPGRKTAV